MDITKLKNNLHQIIDRIDDDAVLQAIYTLLSSKEKIIAHSVQGQPLTQEEMEAMIEESEEDIRSGRTTTHENLKNEIHSWRNRHPEGK